jgi:hypothetical protein
MVLTYLLTFPTHFTIWDEISYFRQLQFLMDGQFELLDTAITNKYPIGTALFAVPFVFIGDMKACFTMSLFSAILSLLILMQTIKHLKLNIDVAYLILLYPPLILLSRSFMSDLPALLISTIFFYVFFCFSNSLKKGLSIAFLFGLGLLVREPLIILFTPFLMVYVYQNFNKNLIFFTLALIIASSLRPLSNYLIYHDIFFMKDPGIAFGFDLFFENLMLYVFSLTFFVPLGLIAVFRYKDKYQWIIKLTIAFYILFFCFYQYNGFQSGFLKGLILGPRFLLPITPLVIICIAYMLNSWNFKFKPTLKYLPILCLLIFISTQVLGKAYNNQQQTISDLIYSKEINELATNDFTQASKILNPLDQRYRDIFINSLESIDSFKTDQYLLLFGNISPAGNFETIFREKLLDNTTVSFWEKN